MKEYLPDVVGATTLHSCLACGSDHLVPMLDLNHQPLANAFKTGNNDEHEPYFPLAVNMCTNCHHLQLTHAVSPELIYKNYLYVSGTSQTYLDYMDWYARFTREQMKNWPSSVLDIGCNDGSQLDAFKRLGLTTFGVDPAENLHPVSTEKGHNVVCGFWDEATQASFGDQKFNIITSQNAFAHIPDPLGYLKLVRESLAYGGRMFISTSQADMIVNDEFDTIYHEHISFFNIKSMKALAERAGLFLVDVIKTPIHGISYIFVLSKEQEQAERVNNLLAMEQMQGLYTDETYAHWAANTLRLVDELKVFVELYRNKGYVLAGYGAAAKGNTLLNFSKVKLDFIIDDNPLKQGMYSPGMDIPIVSIDHLKQYTDADKVLFVPLAWNFFKEIKRKIQTARSNENDKFLKYFPKVEIL
jgi:2-polyprenyl-3-methyl-5-hydroxy-6-metoxy-1,4-benzoquinol methylase